MTAIQAFLEGVSAVSPFRSVQQVLHLQPNTLHVKNQSFPLQKTSEISVISFGKASLAMAAAAEAALGSRFTRGAIITGTSSSYSLKSHVFYGAKYNLPDEDSVSATTELLSTIKQSDFPENIILFLISGGGSALFCSPEGVSLDEKLAVIRLLVSHGATIQQLNIVRQGLSQVKGGKTLQIIKHAQVISLIISDVIDDPVDLIASGPTVIPVSSMSPLDVFRSLNIPLDSLSTSVIKQLKKEKQNYSLSFVEEKHFVIASNSIALKAVDSFLQKKGYSVHVVSSKLSGNASLRGAQFAALLASQSRDLSKKLGDIEANYKFKDNSNKIALIFGGETTVEGAGKGTGKGGRNQHMVLECLRNLLNYPAFNHQFCFLSAGTDGQDGPTISAGAFITNDCLTIANHQEIDEYLHNFDSFNFWTTFDQGRYLLNTGPTGTNVMDIQICILDY